MISQNIRKIDSDRFAEILFEIRHSASSYQISQLMQIIADSLEDIANFSGD